MEARLLLEWVCGTDRNTLLAHGDRTLSTGERQAYEEAITRRRRRVPLQQITGCQAFMGLEFQVNGHVLVPRQDTEILVEEVMRELQDGMRVLDLCTGSGCIAVSLSVLGGFEDVTATDLSFEALKVAKENAERLLNQGRAIRFLQGDLFDCLETRFDIITANPPYIATGVIRNLAPEVRDHEPRMALDGDEDGLCFYRRIAAKAGEWLEPGGCIYLEIGYDQGLAVSRLLEETGFENIRIVKDTPGLDRVVYAEGGRNV